MFSCLIKISKYLLLSCFCLLFRDSCAQYAHHNILEGWLTLSPHDTFNGDKLLSLWVSTPIPTSYYNQEELKAQQTLNEVLAEQVLSYDPQTDSSRYDQVDREPITPLTWKWVHLHLEDTISTSEMWLRRPNWWLLEKGADQLGNKVWISIEEFGMEGMATVVDLYPSRIDTRLWNDSRRGDFVYRPIIGKYIHQSTDVYQLFLHQLDTIGVTGNHPIWSIDRNRWVHASDLNIGEKIFSSSGIQIVSGRKKLQGEHVVYNIEVYRSHNYLVSLQDVLVHNGPCFPDISSDFWKNLIQKGRAYREKPLGNFTASYAAGKNGDTYGVALTMMMRQKRKVPGDYTDAMELLIREARASGAKNFHMVADLVLDERLYQYYKNIHKHFKGLSVEGFRHPGEKLVSFRLAGNLDEIQRIKK